MYNTRKNFLRQITLASLPIFFGINGQKITRNKLIELDEF